MWFVQDLCSLSENSLLSIKNINRFCLLPDSAEGLKKFLTFLTGLEEVPPLAFSKKIEVKHIKSDFFYRPGDKWHKIQKSKFEIFCPEPMVFLFTWYIFLFESCIFFSRKKKSKSTLPLIIENGTKFKRYMGLQKRLINVLLQNILDKFKSEIERQNISE